MSQTPAPFAIGTSSSVAASSSNVDMSLDDLITNRRNAARKQPARNARNNAARQTGQNKARRGAAIAARRGIANASGNKPTPMETERQVNRAQRRIAGNALKSAVASRGGGRGPRGGARGTAPRVSDVKARAKARLNKARTVIAQQKAAKGKSPGKSGVAAPTQQAVSAAAKAMKDYGFKAPKGMQMQISFVPKKPAAGSGGGNKQGGGRGNTGRGGGNRGNNNSGGRGGRGRGRR